MTFIVDNKQDHLAIANWLCHILAMPAGRHTLAEFRVARRRRWGLWGRHVWIYRLRFLDANTHLTNLLRSVKQDLASRGLAATPRIPHAEHGENSNRN